MVICFIGIRFHVNFTKMRSSGSLIIVSPWYLFDAVLLFFFNLAFLFFNFIFFPRSIYIFLTVTFESTKLIVSCWSIFIWFSFKLELDMKWDRKVFFPINFIIFFLISFSDFFTVHLGYLLIDQIDQVTSSQLPCSLILN